MHGLGGRRRLWRSLVRGVLAAALSFVLLDLDGRITTRALTAILVGLAVGAGAWVELSGSSGPDEPRRALVRATAAWSTLCGCLGVAFMQWRYAAALWASGSFNAALDDALATVQATPGVWVAFAAICTTPYLFAAYLRLSGATLGKQVLGSCLGGVWFVFVSADAIFSVIGNGTDVGLLGLGGFQLVMGANVGGAAALLPLGLRVADEVARATEPGVVEPNPASDETPGAVVLPPRRLAGFVAALGFAVVGVVLGNVTLVRSSAYGPVVGAAVVALVFSLTLLAWTAVATDSAYERALMTLIGLILSSQLSDALGWLVHAS